MSKLILLLVLAAAVAIEAYPQNPDSTTVANNCKPNSMPITTRGDTDCVPNCANHATLATKACTKILHIGNFCKCAEGFVFKSGTDGECVQIADCPSA